MRGGRQKADKPAKDKVEKPGKIKLRTLDDIDHRCSAAFKVRSLVADFVSDAGGKTEVSAARRQLIERAALLSAILQDYETRWLGQEEIEISSYLAGANTLRRILCSLGLERKAKAVPDLYEYLRQKRREQEEQEQDTIEEPAQ